jgi:hypothetical protein
VREVHAGIWHWEAPHPDWKLVRNNGLEIPADWVGAKLDQIREGLRPLLDLPGEHVLATHGGPTDRAALERALS